MQEHYRIVGGLGSPYSMKTRAVFRYRRIPFVFEMLNGLLRDDVSHVRPQIIPMVRGPDDSDWMVDSTPILYELEARHENGRSILPDNAADRFLAELIEDFGDEWLTKAMFHYRWYYATDRDFSSYWIATDQVAGAGASTAKRREFAEQITQRQVGRMALVGATELNKPVIENSYERVLDALELEVGCGQFLFGSRPSIGDFGLFGQLKTLSDDTTPQWLMRQRAPTVCHWVRQMDDLSGTVGEWRDPAQPLATTGALAELLKICGDSYLPFLAANEQAINTQAETVELEILGRPFAQPPFRYQVKCYARLKSAYRNLPTADAARIDGLLQHTGCLPWLSRTNS